MAVQDSGDCVADRNLFSPSPQHVADQSPLHPGIVRHPLLTPDVQVALLTAMDETGDASLTDLADAIPDHPRPISAVLAMIDAGLAEFDLTSPFDAHIRISRTQR